MDSSIINQAQINHRYIYHSEPVNGNQNVHNEDLIKMIGTKNYNDRLSPGTNFANAIIRKHINLNENHFITDLTLSPPTEEELANGAEPWPQETFRNNYNRKEKIHVLEIPECVTVHNIQVTGGTVRIHKGSVQATNKGAVVEGLGDSTILEANAPGTTAIAAGDYSIANANCKNSTAIASGKHTVANANVDDSTAVAEHSQSKAFGKAPKSLVEQSGTVGAIAVSYDQSLAEKGDVAAMYRHGKSLVNMASTLKHPNPLMKGIDSMMTFLNEKGELVSITHISEGLRYLNMASKNGDSDASAFIASLYLTGLKVKQDMKTCLHFVNLAHDQGHKTVALEFGEWHLTHSNKKEAANWFFKAATQAKSSEAAYQLGLLHVEKKEVDTAIGWLKLAANNFEDEELTYATRWIHANDNNDVVNNRAKGKAESSLELAKIYAARKDNQKASAYFDQSFAQGTTKWRFDLANKFLSGDGVEKNIPKAISYYEKLIALGHHEVAEVLGDKFLAGDGVEQDTDTAIAYFDQSIKLGNRALIGKLGEKFWKGDGVPKDVLKGLSYFEELINKGNYKLAVTIGNRFLKGDGVDKDVEVAIHYFKRAAANDEASAYISLGLIYAEGIEVKQDLNTAMQYFQSAAQKGKTEANMHIGDIFQQWDNPSAAIKYFTMPPYYLTDRHFEAAEMCLERAVFYHNKAVAWDTQPHEINFYRNVGEDVNQNTIDSLLTKINEKKVSTAFALSDAYFKKGMTLLERFSNKKGDAKSSYKLGMMYAEGRIMKPDLDQAMHYLSIAQKAKHPDAAYQLGLLSIEKTQLKEALRYFKEADDMGCKGAKEAYANCAYMYGEILFATDKETAISLFQDAAKAGHAFAKQKLEELSPPLKPVVQKDSSSSIWDFLDFGSSSSASNI